MASHNVGEYVAAKFCDPANMTAVSWMKSFCDSCGGCGKFLSLGKFRLSGNWLKATSMWRRNPIFNWLPMRTCRSSGCPFERSIILHEQRMDVGGVENGFTI